jgi:hypothetical protein
VNTVAALTQNSSKVEYHTDPRITTAARLCMGSIDLDPASCAKANVNVGASLFFGIEADGIHQDWFGNVWMNHPFGRFELPCQPGCEKDHDHHSFILYGNKRWINKLVDEFDSGNVVAACCITFSVTSEAWFRPLLKRPQCFLVPRTNYYDESGKLVKGVLKGSVVTYFGNDTDRFYHAFKTFGEVKVTL